MTQRFTQSAHWGAHEIVVENGRAVAALPLASDLDPSPMLEAMAGMNDHVARVRRPAFRRGWLEKGPGPADGARGTDSYVELPWDEALDRIAAEIARVRDLHGNEALFSGSYGWCSAGRFHHAKTQMQRFFNLIGGSTTQIHSYSFAAAQALLPRIIGTLDPLYGPLSSWDGIARSTRVMVCFGGIPMKNTQVESGGCGEHSVRPWLRELKARGVRLINISPLRDDIEAEFGAEWIPVRPGSDTAILMAMSLHLIERDLHDRAFLDSHCTGFARYAAYLRGETDGQPKTADWAAALSGMPAARIRALAEEMAAERSLLNLAWSLQRADHGEQPYWAAVAFAAMLGQIGLEGGGFGFGYGAEAGLGNPRRQVSNPTHHAGRNPCPTAIPVARIADMLLNPGTEYDFDGTRHRYPEARLICWAGGNPFHHHQDLTRLAQAFQRPDTIIVSECWWTATARHADIVLPATTPMERNDIGASKRDRFLIPMKRAVAPQGEARDDFQIFAALAERFGLGAAFTEGLSEMQWLERIWDDARGRDMQLSNLIPDFAAFWENGPVEVPLPEEPFTVMAGFRRDPLANPLATPSGRIEIFSETIAGFGYDDCPGHPTWFAPEEWLGGDAAAQPLHLISNQPRTRLHSQMDAAGPSAASKIAGREPLHLHPDDAAARGLKAGDVALVWNARGRLLAGIVPDAGVMPGVAVLATGAWYDPDAEGGPERHGNPNVLTRDAGTSRLAQGCSAQSCMVEIDRWTAPLPRVRAHHPAPLAPLAAE